MWTEIPGFNGDYSINKNGQVKSNNIVAIDGRKIKERILKPFIQNNGYYVVDLRINNKTKKYLVHRLMAMTFLTDYDKILDVNHKDGNKLNNSIYNLEMTTRSENIKHAHQIGLRTFSLKERKDIGNRFKNILSKPIVQLSLDGDFINFYESASEASRLLDYDVSAICRCANKKQKTSYGFKWEWYEV